MMTKESKMPLKRAFAQKKYFQNAATIADAIKAFIATNAVSSKEYSSVTLVIKVTSSFTVKPAGEETT